MIPISALLALVLFLSFFFFFPTFFLCMWKAYNHIFMFLMYFHTRDSASTCLPRPLNYLLCLLIYKGHPARCLSPVGTSLI